ncbi:DUF262 domain-containing protein [Helicobacter pylori]|uniref:DUF262 domain-containing protein n=1 Tax=Helicobacter pylori TaxID=210 RepID=UPI001AA2AC76|nr:DUF262 domain-containing protein [Helicobacter pylori]GHP31212.1 hypothetical protein JP0039_07420 [Helicobacter pylori]
MANESIEGEAYQLKDILATELSAYYQIPTYQRPYQWTEENCEKPLDDLLSSYECYKESDYFCGSLVLIAISKDSETNATTYDIVDGQQRLSTFILLAKVLATLYDKDLNENCKISRGFLEKSLGDTDGEKRKRLIFDTIGLNAKDDFQDALDFFDDLDASKGESSKSNAPSKGKNSYLKNAICLKNYLEKKEIEDINDFIRWLYLKVIFIKTTCSNISMALRIFSVLNARGLPLHAIDVFKVELLKKLAKEKDQEDFVYRWNALRQKCLDNESKFPKRKENKREKNAAEILFSWYLTYLHPKTSKERMKIRLNTQFDELQKSPLEYLDVVEDFYNAYCEVLEMQDRYAHLLSYLEDNYWRAILCASILHDYSESKIEALKELLVKFYYQHWVAGQAKSTREQTCCNIINALKEKKNIDDIISIARKNLGEYSVTQHFKEKLRDSLVYKKQPTKNPWIKPILILVEYFMSDDPNPKRIQTNDFHVEHILPQKPTLSSQWAKDFSEEEREHYTHSLANLTLLGGKRNIEASNLDFKDKKKIYMGEEISLSKKRPFRVMTCYKMTIDIAHHYTEWTPKSLEKREKDLMNIIESVLTL